MSEVSQGKETMIDDSGPEWGLGGLAVAVLALGPVRVSCCPCPALLGRPPLTQALTLPKV